MRDVIIACDFKNQEDLFKEYMTGITSPKGE